MTPNASESRLWARYLAIGMGILILLWLPVEDKNEWVTIIMALGICTLSLTHFLISHPVLGSKSILLHTLAGGLAGAATLPVAIFLMAIKAGLHDHDFSEYSIKQIANIIDAMPFFIVGGLLIASGGAIWRFTRR